MGRGGKTRPTGPSVVGRAAGSDRRRQHDVSRLDAHVGQRMRARRIAIGLSQKQLGAALGLTFSQVQKYEKGQNRIGAGRLWQIAGVLDVGPDYFFVGLRPAGQPVEASASGLSAEIARLTAAFKAIPDAARRNGILALVESVAADAGDGGVPGP